MNICLQPHVDPIPSLETLLVSPLIIVRQRGPGSKVSSCVATPQKGTTVNTLKLLHVFLLCHSKRQTCRSLQVRNIIRPSYQQVNRFRQCERASQLRCEHPLSRAQQHYNTLPSPHSNPQHLQHTHLLLPQLTPSSQKQSGPPPLPPSAARQHPYPPTAKASA
jgi:hypothetical protein